MTAQRAREKLDHVLSTIVELLCIARNASASTLKQRSGLCRDSAENILKASASMDAGSCVHLTDREVICLHDDLGEEIQFRLELKSDRPGLHITYGTVEVFSPFSR